MTEINIAEELDKYKKAQYAISISIIRIGEFFDKDIHYELTICEDVKWTETPNPAIPGHKITYYDSCMCQKCNFFVSEGWRSEKNGYVLFLGRDPLLSLGMYIFKLENKVEE